MTVIAMPTPKKSVDEVADFLELSKEQGFTDVLVIGINPDGYVLGSTVSDNAQLLWVLEMAKQDILNDSRET